MYLCLVTLFSELVKYLILSNCFRWYGLSHNNYDKVLMRNKYKPVFSQNFQQITYLRCRSNFKRFNSPNYDSNLVRELHKMNCVGSYGHLRDDNIKIIVSLDLDPNLLLLIGTGVR